MAAQINHEHSTQAIRERLEEDNEGSYLRDWIYGGIDGAVTTFAIVCGVVGADFSTSVILVLGAANIVADGFSMAASCFRTSAVVMVTSRSAPAPSGPECNRGGRRTARTGPQRHPRLPPTRL